MGAFRRAWDLTRKFSFQGKYSLPKNGEPNDFISRAKDRQLLPSFLVIGPPRTGTSWLHAVLGDHTHLPHPTKETRFFDTHFHRGVEWYRKHYPRSVENVLVGEIAPTYFASQDARDRIARTIPWAKVICIFRHPVDRVLSLYRVKRAYGMIPWTFEQAMERDPELIESSRYASNLTAWQNALGKEQVRASFYEDLCDEPQLFVDSLADFIGIPRFSLTPMQICRMQSSGSMTEPRSYYRTRGATKMADWCKAQRLDKVVAAVKRSPLLGLFLGGGPAFAELSPEVVLRMYELFRPEVEALEVILNRDLSTWKAVTGWSKSIPVGA